MSRFQGSEPGNRSERRTARLESKRALARSPTLLAPIFLLAGCHTTKGESSAGDSSREPALEDTDSGGESEESATPASAILGVEVGVLSGVLQAWCTTGGMEPMAKNASAGSTVLHEVQPGSWWMVGVDRTFTACNTSEVYTLAAGESALWYLTEFPGTYDRKTFSCTMP